MRNFEACREAQANGLLRIPVNENPFEKRSRDQIALVGKIVEALRTSACKVEMVKHLVDFHGSPLAPRIRRHTLDTSPILLPLLLREKEIPIDLLCTKGPRDVTSYRDPRNPKVTRKGSAEHIHGRMSPLEELFRKRRVCDDVREVRRSEPLDIAGAEIAKNVVKAGRRFAANDVAKGGPELVLKCQARKLHEDRALLVQRYSLKTNSNGVHCDA